MVTVTVKINSDDTLFAENIIILEIHYFQIQSWTEKIRTIFFH
jgi:hypothetical protein